MQKLILCLLLLFPSSRIMTNVAESQSALSILNTEFSCVEQLFKEMQLEGIIDFTAFRQAVTGYHRIEQKEKPFMTIIDFTKPSTEKRLFVLDMEKKELLFSSVVSHGKNSSGKYATSFSNKYGSYKSSLGFYLTEHTYQGRNGYSMILNGLEKSVVIQFDTLPPFSPNENGFYRIRVPKNNIPASVRISYDGKEINARITTEEEWDFVNLTYQFR